MLEEKEEQIRVLKRRNKKQQNKKAMAALEGEIEDVKAKLLWYNKLLHVDVEAIIKIKKSPCRMVGTTK